MAHGKFNSAQQLATGTGTGPLALGAATSSRFRTLQTAGLADGDSCYVRIQHETIDAEWEDVLATRSGGNITRTFDAKSSSPTGALIAFSAGNKIVSAVILAQQVLTVDDAGKAPISVPMNFLPISAPATPASGSQLYVDSADGVPKLKSSAGAVTALTGNIPETRLNSGTSAGGTTFWRGDGVWAVPGVAAAPNFATSLQAAVNVGQYLDWPHGDVTLTSPLVITVPSGSSDSGFDMHGAKLICGFNAATSDMIKFLLAAGTNDFAYSFRVRNTQFNGAGSPSFNGSTNQCRNGLVFEAIGGAASFFGITTNSCHFYAFPNGSGLRYYGGIFESYVIDVDTTNCGIGVELKQQNLGAGGQVLSTIYVIGGDIRQCGLATPTQGDCMGGVSSTVDAANPYSGSHSVAFKNLAFVNHRGPGLYLSAGALQVDCCHFEATCRLTGTTFTNGAIYSFYGGVNVMDCDGANPDGADGQKYLVDFPFSDTSREHSNIMRSYNVTEGGGSFAKLGRILGASTMYIDGWSNGATGMWDGAGTWTIRTLNYTNTTA